MYFTAKIEVDPAQATIIRKAQPSDAFGKLIDFLSRGKMTPQEEEETFCAVSIIENLQAAFAILGITNLIKLTKNKVSFYVDEENNPGDLHFAVDRFVNMLRPEEESSFENLLMALDHSRGSLHYLIEVEIRKRHAVGAYPLTIRVNAFPEMEYIPEPNDDWFHSQTLEICTNQISFDEWLGKLRTNFNSFLEEMQNSISTAIEVTDIKRRDTLRLIRPRTSVGNYSLLTEARNQWQIFPKPTEKEKDPLFANYNRFEPYFYSCLKWTESCHLHAFHLRDFEVVDGNGCLVFQVPETGIRAGETGALNPLQDFEPPKEKGITFYEENAFFNEIDRLGLVKR